MSLDAPHTQTETARVPVMEHGADYLLTVKKNQPTLHETLRSFLDTPAPHFFPEDRPIPTEKLKATGSCVYRTTGTDQASSHQINKERDEVRNIFKAGVSPEQTGFPFAAQAAKLDRFTPGRKPEQVVLLTSLPPSAPFPLLTPPFPLVRELALRPDRLRRFGIASAHRGGQEWGMVKSPSKALRLLVIAEACNPEWTSVPLVGYNFVRALAERDDLKITLATHPRNRAQLEKDPITAMAEIVYPNNDYVAGTLYRLAQLLRGDRGKGWTTNTAFASIAYLFFEYELHKLVRARLRAGEFDAIHRVTPVTPTVGSPLASWTHVPMILGPLNGGLPWPPEFPTLRKQENEFLVPLRKIYRLMPYYGATYRRIRAAVAGSQHTASEVPASFKGKKFLLPENGVDPTKFEISDEWTPPPGRFRFVTVGRLVPYKGLWLTLAAMRDSELLKTCDLAVIGDGPDREKLERMAADYGLGGCVKMLGQLDQKTMSAEMRSSQCFVFPSLREFGGGVVIEAMASGLPSIVVDYGGPRDLIDAGSGILIPMCPESEMVPALREAMERVVGDHDLCRRLARSAAERIRTEFTWDVKAEKLRGIYREVVGI